MRPDVRTALRAPVEKAGRKWIAARDRLSATGYDDDKTAAIEAAIEYRAALMKLKLVVEVVDDANSSREIRIRG